MPRRARSRDGTRRSDIMNPEVEDSSMAQEKEERPAVAAVKKAGETGDDSARKTAGPQSRTTRESGTGGNGGVGAALPVTRRERYIIGTRTPGAQPFGQLRQQHSMNDVVAYLNLQENVEVVKRIRLGGTEPFTADGRSVSEAVAAKIDVEKAQRLQAIAPPDQ